MTKLETLAGRFLVGTLLNSLLATVVLCGLH